MISRVSVGGVEAAVVQRRAHLLDELGALELARGDVDRDVQRDSPSCARRRPARRPAPAPSADRDDQAVLLGDRDERVGRDHAARGMAPAQQRLDAHDALVLEVEHRLVDEEELVGARARRARSISRWMRSCAAVCIADSNSA